MRVGTALTQTPNALDHFAKTLQVEYVAFRQKHRVEYDEKMSMVKLSVVSSCEFELCGAHSRHWRVWLISDGGKPQIAATQQGSGGGDFRGRG
jgi:hypothetical protein